MDKINLQLLHSNAIDKIEINEKVIFPKEIYENTDIKGLQNVSATGTIKRKTDTDDEIDLSCSGEMILLDSISLEEVEYPFSFKIEGSLAEILGNCPNTLDILELLWENIVLEVPIRFTKVQDFSQFSGDGWKLVSEEEQAHENNPFNDLLKEFGEE